MNRKERRNYEKKYGAKTFTAKVENDAYNLGLEKGRQQSLDLILTMTAYTIDYKLELPRDELCELIASILFNIDAYRTDHLTSEDFKTIKDELFEKGIIIK